MTTPDGSAMQLEDLGKLVLRVSLGGMMLLHGIAKLQSGVDPIAALLAQNGLPEAMVWGVYVGEVVAPVLMIVGFLTRSAGLVLAFNMLVAIYLAHAADVFKLDEGGGWAVESPMVYLLGGLAVACLGAGRISLAKR